MDPALITTADCNLANIVKGSFPLVIGGAYFAGCLGTWLISITRKCRIRACKIAVLFLFLAAAAVANGYLGAWVFSKHCEELPAKAGLLNSASFHLFGSIIFTLLIFIVLSRILRATPIDTGAVVASVPLILFVLTYFY